MALGIMLIVLISQQFGLFELTNPVTRLPLPAALAGMACVVFLLQRLPCNALLAGIGTHSYTIYLWHIVASSAVRGALLKAGVANVPILFALCFTAAVSTPIILHYLVRRIPLVSVAVSGELVAARSHSARSHAARSHAARSHAARSHAARSHSGRTSRALADRLRTAPPKPAARLLPYAEPAHEIVSNM